VLIEDSAYECLILKTLNPKPQILNPKTLNPKPQTPNPKP